MPQIVNKQTGFKANASDKDWGGNTYDKNTWSLDNNIETSSAKNSSGEIINPTASDIAKYNSPSVISSKAATYSLNNIKNETNNITKGIADQNIAKAQTAEQKAIAKQQADANALNTGAALTTAADKNKTNKLLEDLKASIASGAKNTSNFANESSASGGTMTKDQELNASYQRMQSGTATQADYNNVNYAMDPKRGWLPTEQTAPAEAPAESATETPAPTETPTTNVPGPTTPPANETPEDTRLRELEDAHAEYTSKMESITKGTFALSPEDQAQIDATRKSFDDLIAQQKLANKNYEGATDKLGIVSGRSRYAGEEQIGIAKTAVDQGISKIADIESKATTALTTLKQAIKDKNYKLVKEEYDSTMSYLKQKSDIITETNKAVADAKKALTDQLNKDREFEYKAYNDEVVNTLNSNKFSFEQQKAAFDQAMTSKKFTYQQKQDAISNMLNSDKFTWQQKMDNANLALNKDKLKLEIDKASAIDNDASKAEWIAAGSPGTYSQFLLQKGNENTKPANATQTAAAGYALRMKTSMDGVAKLSEWYAKQGLGTQAFTNSDNFLRFLKSPEGKAMEQYERDFINAALRKESGAAIAPSEFENAKKQYFPSPGDGPEIIKQKLDNMKTKMAGMVLESGPALSSEFKKNASIVKYDNLNQYEFYNPEKSKEIDTLWDQFPDKTEEEILDYFQNQSFNNVGGDTNPAIVSKLETKENGTKGGQCGRFVNQITGLGVGDSFESKMAKMDPTIQYPEPGMVFTMPYKNTGHIGFIVGVNDDGTVTVKDSNYGLDEKIKTHKIPMTKISGLRMV